MLTQGFSPSQNSDRSVDGGAANISDEIAASKVTMLSTDEIVDLCRGALVEEGRAVVNFAETIGDEFASALKFLCEARDAVVVAGVGKSGHIACKIASTFRSIGRSAVYLHPGEASHGDLGLVGSKGVALILSNSGETPELSDLITYCQKYAVPIIAITATRTSTLAKFADVTLSYGKVREVCPNGLAPTTSTTLALTIGDALAVGLVELLGTTPEDFRRYHPGGKLGARLTRVRDLMHSGNALPIVAPDTPMQEVVITMSEKGFGVALIAEGNAILGIITDGDMRRNVDRLWQSKASDISQGRPQTIGPNSLASDAVEQMSRLSITCLVVEHESEICGLIRIHDCIQAGGKA